MCLFTPRYVDFVSGEGGARTDGEHGGRGRRGAGAEKLARVCMSFLLLHHRQGAETRNYPNKPK
jgi:hypothetical protein